MSNESEPRPITVSELLARGEGDAFPRSGAPVRRSRRISDRTPHERKPVSTASGMPDYTAPVTPPAHRTVGASGMPGFSPATPPAPTAVAPASAAPLTAAPVSAAPAPAAAGAPEQERERNVVTGVIPVVSDEPGEPGPAPESDGQAEAAPATEGDAAASARAAAPSAGVADDDLTVEERLATEAEPVAAPDAPAVPPAAGSAEEAVPTRQSRAEKKAARAAAKAAKAERRAAEREQASGDQAGLEQAGAEAAGPSALRSWLGVFAELVGGLAVGAGMFWGFTQVWRWNVYFALVLAVVVIFAVVSLAHVLRRKDLPTTLLALAAGMIVTLGPLVFLFVSD